MVSVRKSHQVVSVDFNHWLQEQSLTAAKETALVQLWEKVAPFFQQQQVSLLKSMEMVEILSQLNLDADSLTAAFLTPLFDSNIIDQEWVQENCSKDIKLLCQGVEQMAAIKGLNQKSSAGNVDNIRRMLLAMVEDVRAVVIKLAERLCDLREQKNNDEETRVLAAKESANIYAPLANRLGIGQLKWELEDISFRYLHPQVYKKIAKLLDETRLEREQYMNDFVNNLNQQLQELPKDIFKSKKVASSIKGIIPETFQVIGHYMLETWGLNKENLAVITGPCHAEEVALEKLSYLTVASLNQDLATLLATMIKGRFIQTKVTDDVFGVEYAAVLKNVYAIACGICHGLGYGDNFQAVLVSKSSQEMERFLDDCHEQHRDVKENAYLGDLLVTAYSQFSRNRTFGNMLGKGYTVKSAQMEMSMVAEGYYSTKTMQQINEKVGTDMPILSAVNEIIYNRKSPRKTFKDLEPLLI